jgi:hypothetical protein
VIVTYILTEKPCQVKSARLWAGGVNHWRNVDARVGGGNGVEGKMAFVGVGVAIE